MCTKALSSLSILRIMIFSMAAHVSIGLLADFTRCQVQNVEISHTTDNNLSERIEITGKDKQGQR